MSSFADRFKDKAQIVGKTGEGAMLVQNAAPPTPAGSKAANTPRTLSGHRANRSLLPTEGERKVVNNNSNTTNYRDHIKGLRQKSGDGDQSAELQMGHAGGAGRERGGGGGLSGRSRSHHNTLAENPLGRMSFAQNKYRSKEEYIPNYPLDYSSAGTLPEGANYTPYTVDDWRKHKDQLAVVKGGVGRLPSDTDEQRLYRALRARMKEFGTETETINKVALLPENLPRPPKPLTPPPSDEVLEKAYRRQKAVEFAKNVPKPRVKQSSPEDGEAGHDEDDPMLMMSASRRQKDAELAELEEQHRRDQEAIAAMKRKFAM